MRIVSDDMIGFAWRVCLFDVYKNGYQTGKRAAIVTRVIEDRASAAGRLSVWTSANEK